MQELPKLDDLYRDIILDHYRNPRHHKTLEDADIVAMEENPFCGDEAYLQLKVRDGRIMGVGFQGVGCSISQASGSILSEVLQGKTLEEAEQISGLFKRMMQGEEPSQERVKELGDLGGLVGVRQYPIRIKCALLVWMALEEGIQQYVGRGR